ncbi:MAG: 4-(cytidine 5'-diphospho)-2-C-methyl-D-erythritol kinase [Bacilli bacterium]|nr:4-(cytidine 5'-diphospho)-2-C-methyl-D-erythritol kinase [Bacilli bacterium]
MKTFVVHTPAKINICLNVVGKREDGYHLLDMIILPLALHDSMMFSELKGNAKENYVTVDDFSIEPITYNLATQAIEKLNAAKPFKERFRVNIHKVIPMQSGLGGGSSNAASTLVVLNKHLKLGFSDDELIEIGKSLGADIPFFIKGKPARCRGIGEQLDFVKIKNNYHVLLVKPYAGCSTKGVYEVSDTMELPSGNVETVIEALENGDDDLLAKSIFNALEAPAMKLVPEIAEIKKQLFDCGFKIVQMTGSGSAVFALSTDAELVKKAAKKFEDKYIVEVTKILK